MAQSEDWKARISRRGHRLNLQEKRTQQLEAFPANAICVRTFYFLDVTVREVQCCRSGLVRVGTRLAGLCSIALVVWRRKATPSD